MQIARTIADLRTHVAGWRGQGELVALVPTMGALHEGHLSLVREGKRRAGRVVVSLFVNPTQFGPNEDFTRYPRDERGDAALLQGVGADLLYAPGVADMYPEGARTTVSVREITRRWEGEFRPGHFDGVATIVAKLLIQAAPNIALFGEKDYQQLQVIKRLTLDLDLPIEIAGCPIVRDEAGLALSSRNAYLSKGQLSIARTLNGVLSDVAGKAVKGSEDLNILTEAATRALLVNGFDAVDYLEICDAQTLEPLTKLDRTARLIAVARLGNTRLLDNMPVNRT